MANKEQERQELHRAIWAIANELRGSVDGWDFKSYVLGFLFYRFISEDLRTYINKGERDYGNADYDYAAEQDSVAVEGKDDIVAEKGYFILPSQLFENVRKRAEQRDEAHFTKLVDNSAIAENYYNQSGSSYVEQEDKREKIDIVELNERIEKIVARENELRTAIDAIIKDLEI